ncbi:MAG: toll/interleukin-1 receptor domain-containing protein [Pleurocapsa minor GSE-CHR-MK-17-07R]|jgi:hypothetical protein|nr:toll/interleukin-1 receptor domain-containing protein [Pleurocapsa minor GSE-CHR-MK 17-07R]
MSGDSMITNEIVQVIRLAGERHAEPEVASTYEALMRVIESHGDGTQIYRGRPLSEQMLANLTPWFRRMERLNALDPALLNAVGLLNQILTRPLMAQPDEIVLPAEVVLADEIVPYIDPSIPDFSRQAHFPQQPAQYANKIVNIGSISQGVINLNDGDVYVAPPEMDTAEDERASQEVETVLDPGQQIDAMISYAHKDARWMRRIAASLRAHNLGVWTDEGIAVGTPFWSRAIEDAIRRAGCIVLLMTPAAKKSEYVDKELACADLYKVPIVPVLCDGDARTATSFLAMGAQFTDMRPKRLLSGYNRNIQEIVNAVKAQRDARNSRLLKA